MAEMTATTIANLLLENYGSLITEAVVKQGPGGSMVPGHSVLERLQKLNRVFIGGADGNNAKPREWVVHYGGATANSFGPNDNWWSPTQESYAEATLSWKRVGIPMGYDNLVRVTQKGALRGGMNAVSDDLKKKLQELLSEIELQLVADGTGNSSKDVTGALAFLSTSTTYAGIAQGSYAWWQSILTNASSASLAKSHLRSTVRSLYDLNGLSQSTEMWVHLTQWHKYLELYEDNIRYVPGNNAGDELVPVYSDGMYAIRMYPIAKVPTSEIWIVNTDDLELRFAPQTPDVGGNRLIIAYRKASSAWS